MTSSYQMFVGLDIGYRTFTLATMQVEAKAEAAPSPLPQTEAGFQKLEKLLLAKGCPPAQVLVVLEATSTYWIRLALHLQQAGFVVRVVNPAQAHYFALALLKTNKNDTLDALTLAQLAQALSDKLPIWTAPPAIYHELLQRLNQRQTFMSTKQLLLNQLHALKASAVLIEAVVNRHQALIESLQTQLEQIQAEIELILSRKSEWSASIQLLQTIPGFGLWTACHLVVTTLNFSACSEAEEAVSYIGLAPREFSSGSSVRKRATIGRSGQPVLRSLLYMATLSAARHNPIIRVFYQRLLANGKANKVACLACARKLVHLAFGIIKHQQAFKADYAQAAAA